MSKELEALQRLYKGCIEEVSDYSNEINAYCKINNDYTIVEQGLKDGDKAKKVTNIIFRMFIDDVDINKTLSDILLCDSYEDFVSIYPDAPKEEYDLLKEVLL